MFPGETNLAIAFFVFLFSLPLLKLELNHGDGSHLHEHCGFAVSGAALPY
jgi:hypothetical protein